MNRNPKSKWTPRQDPQRPKCAAVALDCEMVDLVGAGRLWGVMVKVFAADFLSGETLLNILALPTAYVKRWKTEITGITAQTLNKAEAQGRTVKGWIEARSELWRYLPCPSPDISRRPPLLCRFQEPNGKTEARFQARLSQGCQTYLFTPSRRRAAANP